MPHLYEVVNLINDCAPSTPRLKLFAFCIDVGHVGYVNFRVVKYGASLDKIKNYFKNTTTLRPRFLFELEQTSEGVQLTKLN